MLLVATKCERKNYFGEKFSDFSFREIEVIQGFLLNIQSGLVDGSIMEGFKKILQEKGRFLKHFGFVFYITYCCQNRLVGRCGGDEA